MSGGPAFSCHRTGIGNAICAYLYTVYILQSRPHCADAIFYRRHWKEYASPSRLHSVPLPRAMQLQGSGNGRPA